jgi:NitT/TauT family transport system permease protein
MSTLTDALRRHSPPVLAVLGFIVAWQVVVTVLDVPTWLLPSPATIWRTFLKNAHMLGRHVLATGSGAVGGLLIGAIAGIALAIVMARSRLIERILMPLLVIDQSIPKMALAPIFVIWFGAGMMSRIFIAMIISFFPMIVNTVRGMRSIDPRLADLMETLSAGHWSTMTKVRLPNAVPYIFSGLKVAVPLAIIGAVVAEFMQADSGLGYIVLIAVGNIDTPLVFVAVLLMAALSLALFSLVSLAEALILRRRFAYLALADEPRA